MAELAAMHVIAANMGFLPATGYNAGFCLEIQSEQPPMRQQVVFTNNCLLINDKLF